MSWLLQNLPLLAIVFVLISIVRAVLRAKAAGQRHEAGADDTEEQRRVREIQERIRRTIAERRGQVVLAEPPEMRPTLSPASEPFEPPVLRTPRVPPIEPFGNPVGRMLAELQRKRAGHEEPPVLVASERGSLERQARLAEQREALEQARLTAQRRATHVAAEKRVQAESDAVERGRLRGQLLHDLKDPASLRRAFVLREVLGPPVGLR